MNNFEMVKAVRRMTDAEWDALPPMTRFMFVCDFYLGDVRYAASIVEWAERCGLTLEER